MMSQSERIEVYTDFDCPLCRWIRGKVEPLDRQGRIEWMNYRDPEVRARAPYSFEAMNDEMHVRRADGHWSSGFAAWADVLRVLPGWRWFAPLFSLWPLTWLVPIFYRWLAQRRYTLFGVPPPCDESGVCALHQSSGERAKAKE